ncbi:Metallo-dependent phosphatase [Rhizodiscina lignyota]|uniref:Metallo-dependent phosphatase n=1 Tax=Rhizodiscina lignyota TaxID=1504668 RepID=A0A9P4IK12_9PEZI|nr:Metallo-dependent phosphatase [Rhizodiscina lignyota]
MDQAPRPLKRTRIVCISDTHNQTPKLPKGDVLIHAGDLTNQGSFSELEKAVRWLEGTDFEKKIVIAGNHDTTLDANFYRENGAYFHKNHPQDTEACLKLVKDSPSITYLNHESATVRLTHPSGPHTAFKVFGSPYSPAHGLWAFGYTADQASSIWSDIPFDTDVVVTHTPPRGHCDTASPGSLGGCEALRRALWRVRPKLAVCGHKHPGRDVERVKWRLDSKNPSLKYMEDETKAWDDPGAGMGNKKESKVDALMGRMGRKETCIVNASYQATSYGAHKRFNKPIVVDIDLPVWQGEG